MTLFKYVLRRILCALLLMTAGGEFTLALVLHKLHHPWHAQANGALCCLGFVLLCAWWDRPSFVSQPPQD